MILKNGHIEESNNFSDNDFENGLSIYEVIRILNKKPIFLSDNVLRLDNSLKKSNILLDIKSLHIQDKLNQFIALENITEGNIKYVLHITKNNVDEYIYQIPHSYPTTDDYENGIKVVTLRATREVPEVKYINNELRALTDQLIRENNVREVLLIDEEGFITEGSRSNVFFVKNNTLFTAPTQYVLPGTSRKRVLDICKKEHIKVVEKRIKYIEADKYEAVFITGTSPLILPVRAIDEHFYDPRHPLVQVLIKDYFSLIMNTF